MLPQQGDTVTAGCDLGFRSDSSALVIVHKRGNIRIVAEVIELRPEKGAPLKPSVTIRRFAERLKAHGASYVTADAHYVETLREILTEYNLIYSPAPHAPVEAYIRTRMLLRQGLVKLPNHNRLLQQLKEIQGRALPGGGMSVISPRWRTGGHGDISSALVLALHATGGDEVPQAKAALGSREWEEAQREARRKEAREAAQEQPWWKRRREGTYR